MRLYKSEKGVLRFESKRLVINFVNGYIHIPSPQFIGFQIFNISFHNLRDAKYLRISLLNFLLTFIFITTLEEEQPVKPIKKNKDSITLMILFFTLSIIGLIIFYVWVTVEYFLWDVPKYYFIDTWKALKRHFQELTRKGKFWLLYSIAVVIATPFFWAIITLEYFLWIVPKYYYLNIKDCLHAYFKGASNYIKEQC